MRDSGAYWREMLGAELVEALVPDRARETPAEEPEWREALREMGEDALVEAMLPAEDPEAPRRRFEAKLRKAHGLPAVEAGDPLWREALKTAGAGEVVESMLGKAA